MGNKHGSDKRSDYANQSFDIQRKCNLILAKSEAPAFPAPENDLILQEFAQKVNDLNLAEDQKHWLLSQPVEVKWQLLCKHLEEQKKQDSKSAKDALSIIEELNKNPSVLGLKKVHNWLTEALKKAIEKFIESSGTENLINIMIVAQDIAKNTHNYQRQEEILWCLQVITEHSIGISDLIYDESTVGFIALNMTENNSSLTELTLQILDKLCWFSTSAYELVLKALEINASENSHKSRFEFLFTILGTDNTKLKITVLQFINTLVESPVDEKVRKAIKNELGSLNIRGVLAALRDQLGSILSCSELEAAKKDLDKKRKLAEKREKKEKKVQKEKKKKPEESEEKKNEEVKKIMKSSFAKAGMNSFNPDQVNEIRTRRSVFSESSNNDSARMNVLGLNKEGEEAFMAFMKTAQIKEEGSSDEDSSSSSSEVVDENELEQLLLAQVLIFIENLDDNPEINPLTLLKTIGENANSAHSYQLFLESLQNFTLIPPDPKFGLDMWTSLLKFSKTLTKTMADGFEKETEFRIDDIVEGQKDLLMKIKKLDLLEQNMLARDQEIEKVRKEKYELQEKLQMSGGNQGDANEISKIKVRFVEIESERNKLTEEVERFRSSSEKFEKLLSLEKMAKGDLEKKLAELNKNLQRLSAPVNGFENPLTAISPNGIASSAPPPPPGAKLPGPPPPPPGGKMPGPPPPPSGNGPPPPPPPGGRVPGPPPPPGGNGPPPPPPPGGRAPGPPPPPGSGPPPPPPPPGGRAPGPPPPPGSGPPPPPGSGPPPPPGGGPPPPGGLLANPALNLLQNIITKPKITPAVPMRALFWTPVPPNQVSKSLWKKLDDTKVKLDIDELVKTFSQKKPAAKPSEENSAPVEIVKKVEKISFLSKERNQGVDIILGKLRQSNSAIIEGLLSCDLTLLHEGSLTSLKVAIPDDSEYGAIGNYEGELELLAVPDRYFFCLIKEVPAYKARIEGMLFTYSHKELIGSLKSKVEMIENIINQLKSNPKLMNILETILAAGNYLNGTSARGGAFGFTIDSLSKVIDMRGQDGKTTLLDYLILFFDSSQPETLALRDEFLDIDYVSKLPLSQLTTELNECTLKFNFIKKAIDSQSVRAVDKIKEKLTPFYEEIGKILEDLRARITGIDTRYVDLCEFYCANPRDVKFEEFCEKFCGFIRAFDENRLKFMKAKEEKEKKERIDARKKENASNNNKGTVLAVAGISALANAKALANDLRARRAQKENKEKNAAPALIVTNADKMAQGIETRRMTVMPPRE